MKTPRTEDFDPRAEKQTLKSSMDGFPVIESQPAASKESDTRTVVPPVRDVSTTSSTKRKIKSRHPFDIYEDQYEALKQRSIEERMRGGLGSQSAMVREAIDDYLKRPLK